MQNAMPVDDNDNLQSPVSMLSGRLRVALGIVQGLLLYALYSGWTAKAWISTQPMLFIPALMLAVFLPIVAVSGIGHLSRRNVLIWLATLAIVLCGLGVYDAWRADLSSFVPSQHIRDACCGDGSIGDGSSSDGSSGNSRSLPSTPLILLTMAGLFIAQAMMLAGDADGKRVASYRSYFEMAWKLLVQLMFAALFTGLFWLVLETGNALFSLIKLDFLGKLLEKSWFNIPVTTLAFSFALHLSDVRPQIVAGIRKLLLTLLSWLLPMATIVIGAFLLSILTTGLEPLWQTRRASYVLLGATALLIVLINTVYQDGYHLTPKTHRFFAICTRIACLLPVPLVLLATYSLGLRVAEYGWTVSRICGAACALVAAMYATGYALAAIRMRDNFQRISATNVLASFAILVIFLALLSPVADPARIAVADQLHRLSQGKTGPDSFDFRFLRFQGARYGVQALKQLSESESGNTAVQDKARLALASTNRWGADEFVVAGPDLTTNILVHPSDRKLPQEFAAQDWRNYTEHYRLPLCMTKRSDLCDAYFIKPDPAMPEQLMIFENTSAPAIFVQNGNRQWRLAGKLIAKPACVDELKKAAGQGSLNWQLPQQRDIEINGSRVYMEPERSEVADCANNDTKK